MSQTRPLAGWIPVLAGLLWLVGVAPSGLVGFAVAVVPGALLLTGGLASVLLPADPRTQQLSALGGVLGVLLALPAAFLEGPAAALLLVLASAAAFLASGWIAIGLEPACAEVPVAVPTWKLAAKAAADEAMLASMLVMAPRPDRGAAHAAVAELLRARDLLHELGALEKPELLYPAPPPLTEPSLRAARARGTTYEHLCFESGFEPDLQMPGRERWLGYASNRTVHAWVRRHPGGPRPWLLCLHGFGMGRPGVDLRGLSSEWLHRELGLNVVLPIFPLHGPRRIGWQSGGALFGHHVLNIVHAVMQAMWDLRRLLTWVRAQEAPRVGVYGLSLGGYTASLLASLATDLDCVVAGIPPTDFARTMRRYLTAVDLRRAEEVGLDWGALEAVYRVISPLGLQPKVPRQGRAILAGVADRFVSPDHVRDLWVHWERPRIAWYDGGHLSLLWEPGARALMHEVIRETLLPEA